MHVTAKFHPFYYGIIFILKNVDKKTKIYLK